MTPELRQRMAQQAHTLQLRLSHGRVDPVTAATEAKRLFTDAADEVRTRWLTLELGGYRDFVDSRPLHAVLGVPLRDRLADQVLVYRTQRGTAADATGRELKHFFIETLDELVRTRALVAAHTNG